MRKCSDCRIILEPDVSYCPQCGKQVDGTAAKKRPSSVEVGALLTSANLHRLREEWEEAARDAARALGLDPENAEIASLMGTIYEQRGMPDEAAVWYRMALQLNPDSAADRARLTRVETQMAGSTARKNRFGGAWVWAGAALVALAAVLSVALLMRGKPQVEAPPQAVARRPAQTTDIGRRRMDASSPPNAPPVGTRPASDAAGASRGLRTPAESRIRGEAADSPAVRELRARVDDVIADPRHGAVIVTFSVPSTAPVTKTAVLRASAAIAAAAFEANREVNSVTARCLITEPASGGTQIAFVGEVIRGAIEGLGGQPTAEQMAGVFERPWWNPNVPNR